MSAEATFWAWKQPVKSTHLLVLLSLANFANDEQQTWYSYKKIASATKLGRRTVIDAISTLCGLGLVSVQQRRKAGSTENDTNIFTLHTTVFLAADDLKQKEGGAGDALPPSAGDAPPSAGDSPGGGAGDALGGAGAAPESNKESNNSNFNNVQAEKRKFTEHDFRLAEWMHGRILGLDRKFKMPNLDKWADEIRLMREQDGRELKEICRVFAWANQDSFWKANILSPAKLRKQYTKLLVQMGETDGTKASQSASAGVAARIADINDRSWARTVQ